MAAVSPAWAQEPQPSQPPVVKESIEVTATRVPEDVESVPASITIITGEELRARNATDLESALALVSGVSIAPGGDGGPAGSVPEMWGLREFDAFLLVVDDVPWGGAFNPDLPTLDLTDVDRIEVLRGPAPVMYGATSFVGVIHVIHNGAGGTRRNLELSGGSYSSGRAAFSTALPDLGGFQQSLSVTGEQQGFKDDRTEYTRGHVLYRAAKDTAGGHLRFDFDGTVLDQDPASPHPRQGRVLSPLVPLDANHNPSDAKIEQNRLHLVGGYTRGAWSTLLSYTHSERDTIRGFLDDIAEPVGGEPNARGFEQDLSLDDLYFDTHVALHPTSTVQIVAGLDYLYGKATGDAETFDYAVRLNGSGAQSSSGRPRDMGFDVEDERNFGGLYAQLEWNATERLRFQIGARLNNTVEDREAGEEELGGDDRAKEEEEEGGKDSRTTIRGSGVVGVSFLAWESGSDAVWLYADARDTFKPAAIDFGPEAEPDILEPETARSYEIGAKGRNGSFDWDVSAFQMDFENLVLSQVVDGLPELINAGTERFKGAELETRLRLPHDFAWQVAYAWHDATFRDFLREFDGVPTQLEGNRLEMSANNLGATGILWAPASGFNASAVYNYVGDRFLNARNTALAPSYSTWAAGVGYRFSKYELRLDGENLSDERPPVSESELGDAQYYRLPARSYRLSLRAQF
jgi:outer membrane receptor protein involved in Fe transport